MVIFIYVLCEPLINWEIDLNNIKLIKHIIHDKLIIILCSYASTNKLLFQHYEFQLELLQL